VRQAWIAAVLCCAAGAGVAATNLAEQQRALVRAHQARDEALRRSALFDQQTETALDSEHAALARTAALAARVQAAEADVDAGARRIDLIEALRRRQRVRLADAQRPAFQVIAALQLIGRRPPVLALVAPGSLSDIVHVRAVLGAVAPVIAARTAGLRAEIHRGLVLRAEADQALAALKDSRAQLVIKRNALVADAAAAHARATALANHALFEQDRAIAMGEKARDIKSFMATVTEEAEISDSLAELPGPSLRPANLAQLDAGAPPPTPANSAPALRYRLPVIGSIVTGMGEETTPGVRARGLSIATTPNALVVAPSNGRILYAGPYRGFGQIIIINHGQGLTTLITNLNRLSTSVGATVIGGSPLGYAGADQPVIMVELRRGGVPIDITPLLS
jgi:septal ring factor EnvC (AmiA/AmiB activator)